MTPSQMYYRILELYRERTIVEPRFVFPGKELFLKMGVKTRMFTKSGKNYEHVSTQSSADYLSRYESGLKTYREQGWRYPFFVAMFTVSKTTGAAPIDKIVSNGTADKIEEHIDRAPRDG